jgi:hypothetical protein
MNRRRGLILLGVIVLSALASILFGLRSYNSYLLLRSAYEAGRPQVSSPRAWMTLDHVAAAYRPLRHIYGVSDKVLMMTLSSLLLASSKPLWSEVGASMIAVDTLVHNFLHRTGILHRLGATHPYGAACYRPNGCADIIRTVSTRIDARPFNRTFPQAFPRFVQLAIWRYCAQGNLNICNGKRIDDRHACQNRHCIPSMRP